MNDRDVKTMIARLRNTVGDVAVYCASQEGADKLQAACDAEGIKVKCVTLGRHKIIPPTARAETIKVVIDEASQWRPA